MQKSNGYCSGIALGSASPPDGGGRSAVAVKSEITPPGLVTISGKDLEVLLGLQSPDRFFQNAKEQKRQPQKMRIDTIPGMGAVHVRWLVRGEGPYTVSVRSVKGGSARGEVSP